MKLEHAVMPTYCMMCRSRW